MMKMMKNTWLAIAGFFAFLFANPAAATLLTDVETAITSAKGDALTVGGYVVAAVAALIVITLIIGMVRKL